MAQFGIIGHRGRMGQALLKAIAEAGHEVAGGVDAGDQPGPLATRCDALIDFSAPQALEANIAAARVAGTPLMVGTTGLEDWHHAMIDEAAKAIAILQTGNTSLGVQMLAHLVHKAAEKLGPEWDIEILEMHHRGKVDAPSGTAKILAIAAAEGRGIPLAENSVAARDGMTGPREEGTIGFAVLRGGTVAGDHSAIFAGNEERLVLSHMAENRMIFARGAVRAAQWLIGRPPGRYTMNDVLDL